MLVDTKNFECIYDTMFEKHKMPCKSGHLNFGWNQFKRHKLNFLVIITSNPKWNTRTCRKLEVIFLRIWWMNLLSHRIYLWFMQNIFTVHWFINDTICYLERNIISCNFITQQLVDQKILSTKMKNLHLFNSFHKFEPNEISIQIVLKC